MTRNENASGDILLRLASMLLMAALVSAVPFMALYRLMSAQLAKDIAWCLGFATICALLLTLGGCVNWPERERLACLDYGFVEGTQEYAGCRMQLAENRKARVLSAYTSMQTQNVRVVP